jgi:hypothetical protein
LKTSARPSSAFRPFGAPSAPTCNGRFLAASADLALLPRSTAGSPKASPPPISKRQRPCSTSWNERTVHSGYLDRLSCPVDRCRIRGTICADRHANRICGVSSAAREQLVEERAIAAEKREVPKRLKCHRFEVGPTDRIRFAPAGSRLRTCISRSGAENLPSATARRAGRAKPLIALSGVRRSWRSVAKRIS